ncbi:hypothetical protein KCV87_13120 [Actinosynnema pretiosum subsp. pretiosum]|uniref:Uncharacterized protein n=1 Tax=Actinosynnema pretiosum subsp. pretiosum TaxID=103721 RepID=A0AA45LAV7_9PSEU|nr:hypothetical protein APASM_1430 [Actinosynnema pretiosum subsp. pretiosum]QUF06899.1 hypothetical protein KCV87_13120 [Actinosynnema pretiosum subsp. pretiosum]
MALTGRGGRWRPARLTSGNGLGRLALTGRWRPARLTSGNGLGRLALTSLGDRW